MEVFMGNCSINGAFNGKITYEWNYSGVGIDQ
jgi:hypothetical protein